MLNSYLGFLITFPTASIHISKAIYLSNLTDAKIQT